MIYPEEFPEFIGPPDSERKVYNAMRLIPDEFDVFYNRTFSSSIIKGQKPNFEIDFIVADLRNGRFKGLACIEVKGGKLVYHADGSWIQNGKNMDSPTAQVISSMHSLLNRYSEISRNITFDWMVCFPDIISPGSKNLPIVLDESKLIDQYKLTELRKTLISYFDALYKLNPDRKGLDLNSYNKLFKSTLIRDCHFVLPLSARIESDEKTFIKLTAEQRKLLDALKENPKILIKGIAGSGKTIIAKEIAQESYENGLNVLFLCFNKSLALNIDSYFSKDKRVNDLSFLLDLDLNIENLSEMLDSIKSSSQQVNKQTRKNEKSDKSNSIKVSTYHSFAASVIEASEPGWWSRNYNDRDFWGFDVPYKIHEIKNSSGINPVFDVLIIDEGQDFEEEWFATAEYFLKPEGQFYIFMDEFQNINQTCSRIPGLKDFFKYRLDKNCRSTKNITEKLTKIIDYEIRSLDGMPKGDPVVIVNYKNDIDQQTKILNEIKDLILKGVPPEHILLLLNTDLNKSCLSQTQRVDKLPLQKLSENGILNKDAINYTHISTFKGLEAVIVFIVDTDKVTFDEKVIYTQASRARQLLYLFSKEGSLFDDKVQKWIT